VVETGGLENLCTAPTGNCKHLKTIGLVAAIGRDTARCSKAVVVPGEVAEWLMAPVLKTGIPERVSGVRIPPSPPDFPNPCSFCVAPKINVFC
jgi:hypothetical protein